MKKKHPQSTQNHVSKVKHIATVAWRTYVQMLEERCHRPAERQLASEILYMADLDADPAWNRLARRLRRRKLDPARYVTWLLTERRPRGIPMPKDLLIEKYLQEYEDLLNLTPRWKRKMLEMFKLSECPVETESGKR